MCIWFTPKSVDDAVYYMENVGTHLMNARYRIKRPTHYFVCMLAVGRFIELHGGAK